MRQATRSRPRPRRPGRPPPREVVGLAGRQHHVGAGLERSGRHGQADTAAAAGDERRLSLEFEIHGTSLARTAHLDRSPARRLSSIAFGEPPGRRDEPYLRQHADNPVEWFPWGDEALRRARDEDKPIFLSIGYASCHWCHVMAHESFEDAGDGG